MTPQLTLHIGDHKTGTTSVQQALHQLGQSGDLFYPVARNHNGLAKTLMTPARRDKGLERLRGFGRNFATAPARTGVISAEEFETADPADLARALAQALPGHAGTVRVIAYVRPHADRLLSSYAEQVKIGLARGTIDDFFETTRDKARFHYAPRFGRWRDAFGDRFILRPMVRAQLKDGDVVADFLSLLPGFDGPVPRAAEGENRALDLQDLVLLQHLHNHIPKGADKARHALGWQMQEILLAQAPAGPRTRMALHRGLYDRLADTYMEDAQTLDTAFFDGTPMADALAAAAAKTVAQPLSMTATDHFTAGDLRALDGLCQVLASLLEADPEGLRTYLRNLRTDTMTGTGEPGSGTAKAGGAKAGKGPKKPARGKAGPKGKQPPPPDEDDLLDLL